MEERQINPLGAEPIGKLLARFAIPSIIAMLVSSLYNIVDQFFIGTLHSLIFPGAIIITDDRLNPL